MVDQRVAAEKQNGVGTPYIPPMTRRLKCRIDPEQSPYTCMLPEHKPVRRGREMIDLLAVEELKTALKFLLMKAALHQSKSGRSRLVHVRQVARPVNRPGR
jgi:hypothetical protein